MSLQTQTKPTLSWFFTAYFADGSTIEQNETDTSKDDPKKSSFSDVLSHMKETELTHFSLENPLTHETVVVDLKHGNFEINGTPVAAHNQYFEPHRYPLKLVYFRETRIDQDHKTTLNEDGSFTEEKMGDPRHYINRYFIGWETTVHGENKQVTLAVG